MLMAAVVILPVGAGFHALEREMPFTIGLQTTLHRVAGAKHKWAIERNKPEGAIPKMDDLTPYLREATNAIEYFVASGIEFKLAAFVEDEPVPSDTAIFTRNVTFRRGFCRFYRAGISFSPRTGWTYPSSTSWQQNLVLLPLGFYHSNRGLVAGALFASGVAVFLMFAAKKFWRLWRERVSENGSGSAESTTD